MEEEEEEEEQVEEEQEQEEQEEEMGSLRTVHPREGEYPRHPLHKELR